MIRDAQGGKASRHACAALSATTFHDMRLRRLTTINHALRSYIYRSAVRSMCPGPPADLPSAYPHLAFTRKTTNLPLCGRTHLMQKNDYCRLCWREKWHSDMDF